MAILFVPYESETAQVSTERYALMWDINKGFVFLPIFVKNYLKYSDMDYFKEIHENRDLIFSPVITEYDLNKVLLIKEMFLIIFFAVFAHILICVVLRKEKGKVKIKERFYRLLKSDTFKLIITVLATLRFYEDFHSYVPYFVLKSTPYWTLYGNTWYLVSGIFYLFYFLIFGFILAVIIEKKALVRSLVAGIILSLWMLMRYLYYDSLVILSVPRILAPTFLFLACAWLIKISISQKKSIKILRKVFSLIIFIIFLEVLIEILIAICPIWIKDIF